MKSVVNSVMGHTTTTYYPGKHYNVEEKNDNLKVQKHYAAGSTVIAVRTVTAEADTLQWMISDHLGSTSTTANADGTWNSDIRYTAFGEIRLKTGVTATGYRYTGQLDMQGSIGLDYYVARDKVTVPRRGKAGIRAKTICHKSNGWHNPPAGNGGLTALMDGSEMFRGSNQRLGGQRHATCCGLSLPSLVCTISWVITHIPEDCSPW